LWDVEGEFFRVDVCDRENPVRKEGSFPLEALAVLCVK